MIRVVLAVWIYVCSLVALLTSGAWISYILTAYPADHFRAFGIIIPAISETHARWLPHAPAGLGIAAALSLTAILYYCRRAANPATSKPLRSCSSLRSTIFCRCFASRP